MRAKTKRSAVYKKVTPGVIAECLAPAWSKETSTDPENWSPENPAWGQGAVSALIVQGFLGGEILRLNLTTAHSEKLSALRFHYFNRVNDAPTVTDGSERPPPEPLATEYAHRDIDVTATQFAGIAEYEEIRRYGIKAIQSRESFFYDLFAQRRYERLYAAFIIFFAGEFVKE